jgi:rhodanese-related sulfurtransferase
MEFVQLNYMWILIAVSSGLMLLWPSLNRSGVPNLSPGDATLLINREDAIVIDVRASSEFVGGHIPDARNIPADKLAERMGELEKFKARPLIINCNTGARSSGPCGVLKKAGFEKVYNLSGGVGAWGQAGLPLKKGAK